MILRKSMYSESDTRSKFIDPKLKESTWSESQIIREHYFTDGRKGLGGKRGKRKFADYILSYKGIKLAIIEAKKYELEITEGLEQVKQYGTCLNLRFVYSSNGKGIYEFDLQEGKGKILECFPSPEELYAKIFGEINRTKQVLLCEPFLLSEKNQDTIKK